ncbi:MAG: dihydrofolate reductase family protein [Dehalococcoidia bacterium]
MSKVRAHMSTTLDGYTAGPNQTVDKPFGDGTEHLNDWMFALKSARELFGEEGGETGPSDDLFRERMANIGAEIMGRNMFGGGPGPWNEQEPWTGWWGENPPYHTPVFVLTNYPRAPLPMQGGTTFYFVTDGIESALQQAKAAAGEKDVVITGGANVIRQYLRAGAVDELELHLVPIILGDGERLLDVGSGPQLEQVRVVPGTGVTHLKYRVLK